MMINTERFERRASERKAKNILCPECAGVKTIATRACPGFRLLDLECPTCKGAGAISPEQENAIELGKLIRSIRLNQDMSMAEMAKRLHMSLVQYNALEHGRDIP